VEVGYTPSMSGEKEELEAKVNALCMKRYGDTSPASMKKLFMAYDKNGDGAINKKELKELLADADVGNSFTRGMWVDGVVKEIDADKDGFLVWEEYAKSAGIPVEEPAAPPPADTPAAPDPKGPSVIQGGLGGKYLANQIANTGVDQKVPLPPKKKFVDEPAPTGLSMGTVAIGAVVLIGGYFVVKGIK